MVLRFRRLLWPLRSARLVLEPPRRADVDGIVAAISDREIARATLHIPFPYRRTDAVAYFARARRKYRTGEALSLLVRERTTSSIVGGISLFNFDWERCSAEVGYWITPASWGQGYAPEAVYLLARTVFRDLKLHRLQAGRFEFNEASGRVLEKVGFVREGVARSDVRKGNRWWNTVLYGLLREDLRPPLLTPGHGRPRPRRADGPLGGRPSRGKAPNVGGRLEVAARKRRA
jgi:ribosomal-protein-alanine N-acetyltransferase